MLDILGDKVAYTFSTDMTIGHITQKLKKNVIIFLDYLVFPDQNIRYKSSWVDTRDYCHVKNVNKCKDWAKEQEKTNEKFTVVALQITPDGLNTNQILKELFLNPKGLRYHASKSNDHLDTWIDDTKDNPGFKNVNCINVDFAN